VSTHLVDASAKALAARRSRRARALAGDASRRGFVAGGAALIAGLVGAKSIAASFPPAQSPVEEDKEGTIMKTYAFVIPVLPGMAERDRRFAAELSGPRRAEYEASRARLGIAREQAWQQETPQGTVTIVYLEAENIELALTGLGSSQDPFDRWWREQVQAIHGIDPAQPEPGPPSEPIIDYRRG
jgi:hypothetical protein